MLWFGDAEILGDVPQCPVMCTPILGRANDGDMPAPVAAELYNIYSTGAPSHRTSSMAYKTLITVRGTAAHRKCRALHPPSRYITASFLRVVVGLSPRLRVRTAVVRCGSRSTRWMDCTWDARRGAQALGRL